MQRLVGLDFETYGGVSLPDHGLDRYMNHPTFKVLLGSIHEVWGQPSRLDFVHFEDRSMEKLEGLASSNTLIAAHNAGFEQMALARLGFKLPSTRFVDSAVVARALGAGGKLEAAAPQLLGVDKMDAGKHLIRLFSIPGKYQEANGDLEFDPAVVGDNPMEWNQFGDYCDLDSALGHRIVLQAEDNIRWLLRNTHVTMDMNATGWHVDVELVKEMQRRYELNLETEVERFRQECEAPDLNLSSYKQLLDWCAERGVKAKSFDEKNVARMLKAINKKLAGPLPNGKAHGYKQVRSLLETKQLLGGSSLKKLQTILDTVGEDGRLRDQYLHVGAGQTWRTTGKGVQMQNLKRLGNTENPDDMDELLDPALVWDNDQLAENIRQVFCAPHPDGRIVVGDSKSVESRGLAWLANEEWKLRTYRQGLGVYEMQAATMYGVDYSAVTKPQRQAGKVGELSCGYQAGGEAVQSFADKLGIELSEGEAAKIVQDWRSANPNIVSLWAALDEALHKALSGRRASVRVGPQGQWEVVVKPVTTPKSLLDQRGDVQSLSVSLYDEDESLVLIRLFHGCYRRGRSICYHKPSELKSGPLWKESYTDPKTKRLRFYDIYGGKLTGILTQSFCRELFFKSLTRVHDWIKTGEMKNLQLIGQFHDEIVLEWLPPPPGMGYVGSGYIGLKNTELSLARFMSMGAPDGFPLEADVHSAYRYIK